MRRDSRPKQHHYVPRFYLERFVDFNGRVWVYDKYGDTVFPSKPIKLARESGFYDAAAVDNAQQPSMESRLAGLEDGASQIIARWIQMLDNSPPLTPIIDKNEREIMSVFLAIQALRTAEQRMLIRQGLASSMDDSVLQDFHVSVLESGYWMEAASALSDFIWILAVNKSGVPFYTSDHPVVLRVHGHEHGHRCVHVWQFPQPGSELLFPLSPTAMFYAYDRNSWEGLGRVNGFSSPVEFTRELVEGDNIAQIGHSRRFVFCNQDAFDAARCFCLEHPVVRDPNRNRFER